MKTTRAKILLFMLLPGIVAGAVLGALLGAPVLSRAAEDTMKIVAIDLGERNMGDAAMISDGSGRSLLVDSGDTRGKAIFNWLDANGYRNKKFDTLITHWHDDHAGNTARIILDYNVGTVYMPRTDYLYTDPTVYSSYERTFFYAVRDAALKRGTRIVWLQQGQTINVGSVKGRVLYISGSPRKESDMTVNYINNQSAVIMFTGGGAKYLTAGDIEKPAENRLLNAGVSLRADIFKLNHHGTDTSNQQKFLDAVDPTYAYFGSNRSTATQFTTGEVRASVTRMGSIANVLGTGYNGTITYTCTGGNITVNAERNVKKMYQRLIDKKTGKTTKATYSFNKLTEIRKINKILNTNKYYNQQLNADGSVFTGSPVKRNGRYYLEKDGICAYNTFAEKGGRTYWFDLYGRRYEGGFLSAYGRRYYMNPNGDPYRMCGWRSVEGRKYYFVGSRYGQYSKAIEGAMLTGFKTIEGKRYYFMDSSCKTYRKDDQGRLMIGFFTVNGSLYYGANDKVKGFRPEDYGAIVKNWATIRDRLYYMGSNGVVRKGWQTIGGKRYYMGTNGTTAVNRFVTIDGAVYYFGQDGAMLRGGDFTIRNKRYRFGPDGKMVREINCHLDKNGEPLTGWHELDGKTYYADEDGELARGKREIDGKTYYFDEEDGHLIGQEDPLNGPEGQQPGQEHTLESEDSSVGGQEEEPDGEDDGAPEDPSEGDTGASEDPSEGDTGASEDPSESDTSASEDPSESDTSASEDPSEGDTDAAEDPSESGIGASEASEEGGTGAAEDPSGGGESPDEPFDGGVQESAEAETGGPEEPGIEAEETADVSGY